MKDERTCGFNPTIGNDKIFIKYLFKCKRPEIGLISKNLTLLKKKRLCNCTNLKSIKFFQLKNFINLVESCVGRQALIEILPEQPGDVERTCADISKAKILLGESTFMS